MYVKSNLKKASVVFFLTTEAFVSFLHCFAFFYFTLSKYPTIPIYPSFFKGDHNVCSFRWYIWLSFSAFAFICNEISLFCTDVCFNKNLMCWTSSMLTSSTLNISNLGSSLWQSICCSSFIMINCSNFIILWGSWC